MNFTSSHSASSFSLTAPRSLQTTMSCFWSRDDDDGGGGVNCNCNGVGDGNNTSGMTMALAEEMVMVMTLTMVMRMMMAMRMAMTLRMATTHLISFSARFCNSARCFPVSSWVSNLENRLNYILHVWV